jgi:hypothetical protein
VRRRIVGVAVMVVVSLVMSAAVVPAARAQANAQAAPRKGYQLLNIFPGRFTCEYPAKDWDIVSGGAAALVTLTQKKHEATVVIEYQPLQLELAASEIDDNFAKLEAEPIAARQPDVSGMTSRILDINSHRTVVIEFSRRGATGPEHVRLYSLPIGKHLYRVIGSAPNAMFDRYAPAFEVMASSLTVAGGPAAAPPPAATPKR